MLLIEPSINGPFSMAMLNNQRVLAKCVGHVSPPAVCLHPLLALPARAGLKALVVTT